MLKRSGCRKKGSVHQQRRLSYELAITGYRTNPRRMRREKAIARPVKMATPARIWFSSKLVVILRFWFSDMVLVSGGKLPAVKPLEKSSSS